MGPILDFVCSPLPVGSRGKRAGKGHGGGVSPSNPVKQLSLSQLRGNKPCILDLWTSTCTRCPAALDKLDRTSAVAAKELGVEVISVCLDGFEGAAATLGSGRWSNIVHVSVQEEVREELKDKLDMKFVPFIALLDTDGAIVKAGRCDAQLGTVVDGHEALTTFMTIFKNIHTGEDNKENVDMEGCVGGMCPLPRRKKQHTGPSAAESGGKTGVPTPAATAILNSQPAPLAPSSQPQECVGGVCPLPRRQKKEQPMQPLPTPPQQQCEGGVCKLIRKPRAKPAATTPSTAPAATNEKAPTGDVAVAVLLPGAQMPSVALTAVVDGQATMLSDVQQGRTLLIDLWTTKCTRCPAALDKLHQLAGEFDSSSLVIASVNLDCREKAKDMIQHAEGGWTNLTHLFAEPSTKEQLVSLFNVVSVPFYIIVTKEGSIRSYGSPKQVDLGQLDKVSSRRVVADASSLLKKAPFAEVPVVLSAPIIPQVESTGNAGSSGSSGFVFTLDEDF